MCLYNTCPRILLALIRITTWQSFGYLKYAYVCVCVEFTHNVVREVKICDTVCSAAFQKPPRSMCSPDPTSLRSSPAHSARLLILGIPFKRASEIRRLHIKYKKKPDCKCAGALPMNWDFSVGRDQMSTSPNRWCEEPVRVDDLGLLLTWVGEGDEMETTGVCVSLCLKCV